MDLPRFGGQYESASLISPEEACRWELLMVTLRQDTPELRQSAVNLVLVEGLSARKAAKIFAFPFTRFIVGLRVLVAEPVV